MAKRQQWYENPDKMIKFSAVGMAITATIYFTGKYLGWW